jgi:dihydrofolate synthase/folylpolyglutamate synthase
MPFRTFDAVMAYLNRFTDYERQAHSKRVYTLTRMRKLIEALGRPDRAMKCVHIAGTKGKGSTAHMTEAILRAHGVKTGLYTSPHLVDLLERIRINGEPIKPAAFVAVMNDLRPVLDRLRPTFFETMTAAAFVAFRRARVEAAVIEVGLGGRLDATNVIEPAVCGITRIDYDHMDKLGHTLGAIASEKAGIIKPGVDVVTSETRPAALRPIQRASNRLTRVGRDLRIKNAGRAGTMLSFSLKGASCGLLRLRLPVLGTHQAENAAVAVGLAERVAPLHARRVAGALARVRLPGRVEVVSRRPLVVVDTAHNPFSARSTRAALAPFADRRWNVVFGASRDKDVRGMIRALKRPGDRWFVTAARSPRAASPADLARLVKGAVPVSSVERAVKLAAKTAGRDGLVLVTGSFYVAGEALQHGQPQR